MTILSGQAPKGSHSPRTGAEQDSTALSKWQLLQVIEDIREPLGLKGTSISLLRAMISFIKGDRITGAQDAGHICFASNAALAKRAHVSVQTVERHIARLVSLGLLKRRASGNGKRWARRDTGGRIVLVSGLSVMPLRARYAEFTALKQQHEDRQTMIALLRDKCALALTQLKTHLPKTDAFEALFARARKLLRRRAAQTDLADLLRDITQEIQKITSKNSDKTRGRDTENEGHKEPQLNPLVEEKENNGIEVNHAEMERAYPKLCAALRTARCHSECKRRMDEMAQYLGLGRVWAELQQFGPAKAFIALGYLLERSDSIEKPRSYALHLLRGLTGGTISWNSLRKPSRRPSHWTSAIS